MITMLNTDCMAYMSTLPDKAFELAIVDPPYGIGFDGKTNIDVNGWKTYTPKDWDSAVPSGEYFAELRRVSVNQIVWGGNYFPLPPSRCIVCWDKMQEFGGSEFELAWTSFNTPAKTFRMSRVEAYGAGTIHPTQKPVALYKWLLSRYAKPGDRILDTHGGSGSICIACHDLGYDLTWMELDADYYAAAVKRYQTHAAQGQLFDPTPPKPINQGELL
jgi:site-specific DNA-methyltransferase (adenine-specific)